MGYTAKHFVSLSDLTVQNLNEMELGIQEAHDDTEELDKRLTSLAIDISSITKDLNTLTQDSSAALQAIKDIDNILKQDEELSTVLKNYGTNFLSKDPQVLTDSELRNVYKNLCLTDYHFFKEVKLNGKPVTGSTLEINYPEIDTSLNIASNNSVSNKAITQKLNAIESTFNYYTKTDVIYDHIFNTITSEMFLRQQEDQELRDSLENHTHNDMATKTFVRKEISLIPTPDVSGQINAHNLDKSAHPDIWKAIENMDLSDYALVDHNHDNSYSKLDHTHDYADSDHTHDMSDYVTISTDQVVTGKKRFVVNSGYSSPDIAKFFVGPADNTGFAFGNDGMQAFSGGSYSTMYINYYGGNVQIGNNKNNTLIAQKGSFADTISEEGKLLKDKYAALIHEHDYAPSTHEHNYLPLSGGTLTGNLTGRYIAGTWLQSTSHTNLNSTPATYPVFDSKGWIYSRTLAEMKSDLGVPTDYATSSHNHEGVYAPATHSHNYATQTDIDTSINTFKSWLFDVGEADTIDTIKDIVDEMKAHHDILDALANTYAPKEHTHTNYLPLSGSEVDNVTTYPMTGGITLAPAGIKSLKWQANSASQGYYAYTRYDQNGDEGLTFGTGNNKVSVVFRTDGDMTSTWNQGTPTLHMKNNTVTINKAITGSKADYTLDVGGSIHGTTLYENGVSLASIYSPIHNHPYASDTHNHDSNYQAKGTIDITNTTPTSATKYYPIYSTGTGTGQTARANNDLYYYDSGTWSSFNIGSMGNKGILTLHFGTSSADRYVDISPASALTANRTLTIPDKSGIIALMEDLENYAPASHTQSITTITNSAGNTFTSAKVLTSRTHSGWDKNDTDDRIIPTMSFMAYWNGAYNESGSSNLSYCIKGAFGDIVTKSTSDYVSLGTKTAATMNGTNNASMIVNVQDANLIPGYDVYAHVINMGGYSEGNYSSQIAMPYVNALTDSKMFIRTAKGSTWRDWREVLTTGNIGSYAYPKTGGQLDGSMNIYSTGNNWGEGIRIHPSNGWAGVVLCENANSGANGTSTNTWSMHNNEGTFGIYKNGSNSSAPQYFRNENNQWAIKGDLATHFVKPVSNDTYSIGSTTNRFMQVVADEHVITQNGSSSVYWKINVDTNGNLVFKHS